MKRAAIGLGVVIAASLLVGCSGQDQSGPGGDDGVLQELKAQGVDEAHAKTLVELYEKALEGEKGINFYGISALPMADTFKEFERTFPGLTVTGTHLTSPDTIARVTAEQSSGQAVGGVVQGTSNVIAALAKDDFVEGYEPLVADDIAESGYDAAGYYANLLTPYGAVYNTRIAKDQIPTSWGDLTQKRFVDQITAVDPTIVGVTSTALIFLSEGEVYTQAELDALAALSPKFYPDSSAAINAVGAGERDIMFTQSYSVYETRKAEGGLPIDFAFPMKDANIVQQLFLAIPSTVPNRAASELLVEYLFTMKAQEMATEQGYIPTLDGAPAGKVIPALSDIPNPLSGPDIGNNAEKLKKWTPIFESTFKG